MTREDSTNMDDRTMPQDGVLSLQIEIPLDDRKEHSVCSNCENASNNLTTYRNGRWCWECIRSDMEPIKSPPLHSPFFARLAEPPEEQQLGF